MHFVESLFIGSIVLAAYPILGYPLVLVLIGAGWGSATRREQWTPRVTILIPAYNEVAVIARTIENKLQQDYPPELMQLIVVSDASDDGTDDVVAAYAGRGVTLLRQAVRRGKAEGLNAAMRLATGEIVVFSDANSEFAPDAVRQIVENFADPTVGYVTGDLELYSVQSSVASAGGGFYQRYEGWLRRLETRVGSVVGVNGGVDALRRSLYEDVPADQITDFVLPLRVMTAGLRVVYDERVRSREAANLEIDAEFRMRVRVALRAIRGLWYARSVLAPLRRPLATFCIVSHKVLRYGTWVFMALAFATSALLAPARPLFAWLLALQAVGYASVYLLTSRRWPPALQRVAAAPAYFIVANAAFAVACWRLVRGEKMQTWKPRGG